MIQTNYGTMDLVIDDRGHAKRAGGAGNQPTGESASTSRRKPGAPSGKGSTSSGAEGLRPTYKSKLEAAFANKLDLEKRAGVITDYWYEPFSFKLATGKRYRVDFLRWNTDGSTDCLETKGYHKNLSDSLTHLAWAAQRFPFHRWFKVTWTAAGGWEEREIR